MKASLIAAVALALTMAASATAAENFIGYLSGAQENPPVASPGSGTGFLAYDAGTQMLSVSLSYSGLVANATNAHIHCCSTDVGTNAGVAIHFIPAGFVTGSTSGLFNAAFDLSQSSTYDAGFLTASGGTAAQARDRLLNAMRVGVETNSNIAYFNIHTSFRPSGEIRGNIAPIPEPAAIVLVLIGMMGLACGRKR